MTRPEPPAAVFGEYFVLADRDGGGWHALGELRGDALRAQVAPTGRAIRGGERVAASVWFLGVAARTVSPPFGAAALTGALPVLDPATVSTRGSGPLAADVTELRPGDPYALGAALHDTTVRKVLAPLVEAVATEFTLSRLVLWGNVASAVNGASIVVRAVRPDLRAVADGLRAGAMGGELLAGRFVEGRRRSCCLLYRAPTGGPCADCVLRR